MQWGVLLLFGGGLALSEVMAASGATAFLVAALLQLLQGAPVVSGPVNVESYREVVPNGELLTTSHDGYLGRFGVVHRRVLMAAQDGTRLDGEDTLSPAPALCCPLPGNEPNEVRCCCWRMA